MGREGRETTAEKKVVELAKEMQKGVKEREGGGERDRERERERERTQL